MILICDHDTNSSGLSTASGRQASSAAAERTRSSASHPRNPCLEPLAVRVALADCDRLGLAAAAVLHRQKESTLRMWRLRYRGLDAEGIAELQRLQRENASLRTRLEDLELRLTFLDGVQSMVVW
jgi:hypothetical protein